MIKDGYALCANIVFFTKVVPKSLEVKGLALAVLHFV
jgi:hypothetical protein